MPMMPKGGPMYGLSVEATARDGNCEIFPF
jgi:hypothetical protein